MGYGRSCLLILLTVASIYMPLCAMYKDPTSEASVNASRPQAPRSKVATKEVAGRYHTDDHGETHLTYFAYCSKCQHEFAFPTVDPNEKCPGRDALMQAKTYSAEHVYSSDDDFEEKK